MIAPLYRVSDFRSRDRDPFLLQHNHAISKIIDWANNYLCKSHPQLGRKGPVCPFVGPSIEKDLFFFTVYPGNHYDIPSLREIMLSYREIFSEIEPTTGEDAQFKAILALFPDIPLERAVEVIDDTQAQLSKEFAPLGLMIGEFHAGPPPKPGLWNPDFRPLYAPIPMLVIRHMVPTDVLFLQRERSLFLAYLDIFGDRIPPRMRHIAKQAAVKFDIDLLPQPGPV